jgi:hypothetical protein
MQPISRQRIGEHVPATTNTHTTIELLLETVFLCGPCRGVTLTTIAAIQSVESQSVKRRLGGWYEMAASLGPS